MKDLFINIWKSPASTFAGAVTALCLWAASDLIDAPKYVSIPASGIAIFLGAMYPGRPRP